MKVFLQEWAIPTLVMETIPLLIQPKIFLMIFASWVVGDSMEPELTDGDVVLIKQSINIEDGQIYAIEFNN